MHCCRGTGARTSECPLQLGDAIVDDICGDRRRVVFEYVSLDKRTKLSQLLQQTHSDELIYRHPYTMMQHLREAKPYDLAMKAGIVSLSA